MNTLFALTERRSVTLSRFPAQMDSSSKIPSIIYYDTTGAVKAIGAEAIRGGIEVEAEDNKWSKAEWSDGHIKLLGIIF